MINFTTFYWLKGLEPKNKHYFRTIFLHSKEWHPPPVLFKQLVCEGAKKWATVIKNKTKILSKFMMAFSQNILCVPKHFWNVIWAAQKNREVGEVVASQPAISLFLKSPPCKQNTLLEILSKIWPVDIIFSSNHNIRKSSCGLCFCAPEPLINRSC